MRFSRRLFSSLPVVSTLFLSLSATSAARSLRQHVQARASLDVCATIDESTFSYVNLYLPDSDYRSCIDICLCISSLSAAIQSNNDLWRLAEKYGENVVKNDLTLLVSFASFHRSGDPQQLITPVCQINSAQNREECTYPDNSSPSCTPYNPCAFDCDSPFVPWGDQCVCPEPYKLCNGVCGTFTHVGHTIFSLGFQCSRCDLGMWFCRRSSLQARESGATSTQPRSLHPGGCASNL